MFRARFLSLFLLLLTASFVYGQTPGNFVSGQTLPAAALNSAFASKQDYPSPGSSGITSIAALRALPATANAVAVLTDPARYGTFAFSSTNHTVDVTNDPGQGIYVAPSSDSTGASGAWVRQYNGAVDWKWWGAIPDGVTTDPWGLASGTSFIVSGTDNTPALVNWQTWGVYQTSLGKGVVVAPSCGQYNWNGAVSFLWTLGITPLTINGNKCVVTQNTYNGSAGSLITASISNGSGGAGTLLDVTSVAGGIQIGQALQNAAPNTVVLSQQTGALGQTGHYTVSVPQMFSSGLLLAKTSFTGAIAGNVLTASLVQGPIFIGQILTGAGLAPNTIIQAQLPGGTPGGAGTYAINISQTISSEIMTFGYTGPNFGNGAPFPFSNLTEITGYLINQTAVGDTQITLSNPSDVTKSGVAVGNSIMLGSFDDQYNGYPPNLQNFEYMTVIDPPPNASTGVVHVAEAIRYQHMPNYPAYSQTGLAAFTGSISGTTLLVPSPPSFGSIPIGGLINANGIAYNTVIMSQLGGTPGGAGTYSVSINQSVGSETMSIPQFSGVAQMYVLGPNWNTNITLQGIQVNSSPNIPPGQQNYMTAQGKFFHSVDYVGVGFSESVSANIVHDNPTTFTGGEVDKLNQFITYNNWTSPNFVLSLQSASSADVLVINGGSFGGIVGSAKKLTVRGSRMNSLFGVGSQYGLNTSATYDSCELFVNSGYGTLMDSTTIPTGVGGVSIDGTAVTYLNGTIKVDTSMLVGGGASVYQWAAIPGMHVNLEAAGTYGGVFSNNLGAGIVLSETFDGRYLIINTNLPFATLPVWASGNIYLFHNNAVTVSNCTGSDVIRAMSDAASQGKRYFEYNKYMFAGIGSVNPALAISGGCDIKEVDVNVLSASAASSPHMVITFNTISNSAFTADSGGTIVTINLALSGKRTITQGVFGGQQSGDTITVGGVTSTTGLPTGRISGSSSASFTIFPQAATNRQSAYTELEFNTDCGIVRRVINPNFDNSTNITIPTQGRLP